MYFSMVHGSMQCWWQKPSLNCTSLSSPYTVVGHLPHEENRCKYICVQTFTLSYILPQRSYISTEFRQRKSNEIHSKSLDVTHIYLIFNCRLVQLLLFGHECIIISYRKLCDIIIHPWASLIKSYLVKDTQDIRTINTEIVSYLALYLHIQWSLNYIYVCWW